PPRVPRVRRQPPPVRWVPPRRPGLRGACAHRGRSRRSGGAPPADVLVAGPVGRPAAGPHHPSGPGGPRRPRGEVTAVNVFALLATLGVVVSSVLLVVKAVAERSRRPAPGPGVAL